jgi:3-isopropylmalate/(R)-2-methylmalate dehydratase small subunit
LNEPLTIIRARAVPLPLNDIDTDQIIPARFLKETSRTGFGKHLFADLRFNSDGTEKADFPLNRKSAAGAKILVGGHNFGCGSSREHAPWALRDWGFQAVVSSSFADIFHGNALKNGIVPVRVDDKTLIEVFTVLREQPEMEFTVDIAVQELRWSSGAAPFPMDPFAKMCLMKGVDQLGFLLEQQEAIGAYERAHDKTGVPA